MKTKTQRTRHTDTEFAQKVAESTSIRRLLLNLGLQETGGSRQNVNRRIASLGLDTSHFTGQAWRKGLSSSRKKHWSEHLVRKAPEQGRTSAYVLRRCLIEMGRPYMCAYEDCPTRNGWRGNTDLTLEVDHADGDPLNNQPENLRFLCPNCHSMEPTSSSGWKNSTSYARTTRCICGKKKNHKAKTCITCYNEYRHQKKMSRLKQKSVSTTGALP